MLLLRPSKQQWSFFINFLIRVVFNERGQPIKIDVTNWFCLRCHLKLALHARTDSEKVQLFANYLKNEPSNDQYLATDSFLSQYHQMDKPIRKTTRSEIIEIINPLKSKKVPAYDLINPMIIKNLPPRAIEFLMHLFNARLIRSYFPEQWKTAEIIMIPKL